MLAKIWKKLLLAICIIACLFNVTAKLVNRISLEKVIKSQPEGIDIVELLNITDKETIVNPVTNEISVYDTEGTQQEPVVEETPNVEQENYYEENPVEEAPSSAESTGASIMDYITDTSKYTDVLQN